MKKVGNLVFLSLVIWLISIFLVSRFSFKVIWIQFLPVITSAKIRKKDKHLGRIFLILTFFTFVLALLFVLLLEPLIIC